MTRMRKQRRGQGMTEYIIMVALIAIAAIAVISLFGDNLRTLFGSSANALAGNTSATIKGTEYKSEKKTLMNFADNTGGGKGNGGGNYHD